MIHDLPFVAGSETSRTAAESMHVAAIEARAKVYAAIRGAGADGLTRQEIETATGLAGNTIRPRVSELMHPKRDLVRVVQGRTRPSATGRPCEILIAREFAS